MEPRRIDLDALMNAHAFMRVERPPVLWEVDVDDEPFIRMLGEMIVVGLLHHDVLAELTLNASNVTVDDDGPDGAGDHVAITIGGPGDREPDVSWTPAATEPFWSPDLDAAVRHASATYGYWRRLMDDGGSITVFVPRSPASS
ncbi:MAG TPA: hypothetical protein VNP90_07430, partial [Actinomycetota bacterium]|nr:hypothetical protein [Actinomycetota bacterium]